ncbi:MAG TPA: methionine--tRNA ligase subunit beta [Flavisolibacter sp.]|nr:methionine--tRNA ligase subunit beta [Flavisolibacter sp.]
MHKLTNGKVPKFHNDIADEKDKALIEEIKKAKTTVETFLEEYKFRDALFAVIDLARSGNKYMQEKEPWIKAKQVDANGKVTEEAQALIDNCLHVCLQLSANLAILINPFLPNTAKKMQHMMKVVDKMLDWENAGSLKLLSVGYSLRAPELLFRKIDDAEVQYQVDKLKKGLEESANGKQSREAGAIEETVSKFEELKSEIVYDDFAKLDLRIGTITAAEKVEKADKLLKLQVDLGFETRTIVSGIAQHFSPESLVNKQVIVVVNLAPRKMRGIESQGMILTAEQPDGKLILVNPDAATFNGSTVR